MEEKVSRRKFVASTLAVGTAVMSGSSTWLSASPRQPNAAGKGVKSKICVFSKHLQWLDYPKMAAFAREAGFDGVDLTVRPGGHVEPERVERDLPLAVKAVKGEGLEVPMMVSAVNDPDASLSRRVLETAAEQEIRYYRMGYFRYSPDTSVKEVLSDTGRKMEKLARLNESLGIRGSYQNHAGSGYFGGSIWDLWMLMKDLPAEWLGSQYDLRPAVCESPNNWEYGMNLIAGRIHNLAVKDSRWTIGEDGNPRADLCPLGEGFAEFPVLLKAVSGREETPPASMHFEYPLGGAEHGARELSVDRKVVMDAMKRDLEVFRKLQAGI